MAFPGQLPGCLGVDPSKPGVLDAKLLGKEPEHFCGLSDAWRYLDPEVEFAC